MDGHQQLTQELNGVEQVIAKNNQLHLIVDPITFKTQQLMNFLTANHLELVTLQKEDLSLEEAFLQLTGKTLRD